MRAFLREPLIHFLALGTALFFYFEWSGGGARTGAKRIVLTSAQMRHLAAGFTRTWQRPPSEQELKSLVDEWVREEIAVREAVAAGLDRDDTVLRRRLRQKFEFLVEETSEIAPPTDQQLQDWLSKHASEFQTEPSIEFRQVFLSPDKRGAAVHGEATRLLRQLHEAGSNARIDLLGDMTMLPQEFDLTPKHEISRIFGDEFADLIAGVPAGTWTGPAKSQYGLHLVLVRRHQAGRLPALASVRGVVEREFMADRRAKQLAATYDRLLRKYTVVVDREQAPEAAPASRKGA